MVKAHACLFRKERQGCSCLLKNWYKYMKNLRFCIDRGKIASYYVLLASQKGRIGSLKTE